jgi:phage terminase large subunit GpA-like protein
MSKIAERHWICARSGRPEDEREVSQFVWTTPFVDNPGEEELLTVPFIQAHAANYKIGEVPKEAELLTAAIDVQKFWIYYSIVAWKEDMTCWSIEFGSIDIIPKENRATNEPAKGMVDTALEEARKRCEALGVSSIWVDCNYDNHGWILEFCNAHEEMHPLRGRGHRQIEKMNNNRMMGKVLKASRWRVDDGRVMHARKQTDGSKVWFIDSDMLRIGVHSSFRIPLGEPGCHYMPVEISTREWVWYAKHQCGEQLVAVRKNGVGIEYKWKELRTRHDGLDCEAYARTGALWEFSQRRQAKEKLKSKTTAKSMSEMRNRNLGR